MTESAGPPKQREAPAPITVLGDSLPYADGAEGHLLALMQEAEHTAAGSDALARRITDWPTRYHLSPARANLLMPLKLGPGKRVLDVGCGTGALLRAIAESGAEAYGVEGSYDRCLVAAERLRGMDNAHILCGSLDDYLQNLPDDAPQQFDVIVVCGVLEYTGSASGGAGGPARFLDQLARLLAPGGTIALAIENQWGLKYLLGYPEDHFDTPWVGLEGYWRTTSGVRTWGKDGLEELVGAAGLEVASWYAALPDYKLPTLLIREDMLDDPSGRALVNQFVRSPLSRPGGEVVDADPVLTFQAAVDAGLGMQLANSFLLTITHAGQRAAGAEHVHDALLWLSSSERTEAWRSVRSLERAEDGGWQLRLESGRSTVSGPLRCEREPLEAVIVGQNVEDLIRRAYVREGTDGDELRGLLRSWAALALKHLHSGDRGALFDVMPNNFIVDRDGGWNVVDTEFSWTGEEDDDVYLFRSLWYTAERFAEAGEVPGVTWTTTRHDLTLALAEAAGLSFGDAVFEQWADFERRLARQLFKWEEPQEAGFLENAEAVRTEPLLSYGQPGRLTTHGHTVLDQQRQQWVTIQRELDRQRLLLEVAHGQVRQLRRKVRALEESPVRKAARRVRRTGRGA